MLIIFTWAKCFLCPLLVKESPKSHCYQMWRHYFYLENLEKMGHHEWIALCLCIHFLWHANRSFHKWFNLTHFLTCIWKLCQSKFLIIPHYFLCSFKTASSITKWLYGLDDWDFHVVIFAFNMDLDNKGKQKYLFIFWWYFPRLWNRLPTSKILKNCWHLKTHNLRECDDVQAIQVGKLVNYNGKVECCIIWPSSGGVIVRRHDGIAFAMWWQFDVVGSLHKSCYCQHGRQHQWSNVLHSFGWENDSISLGDDERVNY